MNMASRNTQGGRERERPALFRGSGGRNDSFSRRRDVGAIPRVIDRRLSDEIQG